jgi:hypothetical protein
VASILKVREQPRQAGGDSSDGSGEDTRVFIVACDGVMTRREVLADRRIPQPADAWDLDGGDPNMLVSKRTAEMDSRSKRHWVVTIRYAPRTSGDGNSASPLLRLPKVQFGTYEESIVLEKDLDDEKMETTAGEPFEEAPEWVRNYRMITLTRNEQVFSLDVDSYMDSVCAHALFGKPAKTWRMGSITATGPELDAELGVFYWAVTYVMYYNPKGWTKKIRNRGLRIKKTVGADVLVLPATDDDGLTFATAIDLGEDGDKLAPDGEVVYLERRGYENKSWSALRLSGVGIA